MQEMSSIEFEYGNDEGALIEFQLMANGRK